MVADDRAGLLEQPDQRVVQGYTGFRGEIERIHHETSTPQTILDLQYGYDKNHDRTYERYGGTSATGDAFEYDKARRLTVAWMGSTDVTAPSSNSYTKKIEYTMDDDGNRSSVKVTPYGQSSTTTSYTDNNLNQYTVVGGTNRSHDKNGNLTDDGTLDFEYDYKNQIVRVKQDSTTVAEYKYDALGRRVEKDDQTDVRRYIYSGLETVCVYDDSDVLKQSFVFGEVIDEVLMLEQADVLDFDDDQNTTETTRSFYHRNALGSVMEITEMDEGVAVSYRYDPYGAVTIIRNSQQQSTDPLGNPWMYTARFMDEETGLYYYRARAYSPETGRFLQRDPIGAILAAHLYQYCMDEPTMYSDPLGLFPVDLTVGAVTSVPDIAGHSSPPPPVSPASRMPDAFVGQALLDQWLNEQWWTGQSGPTWMTRFRDNPTSPIVGQRLGPRFCDPWQPAAVFPEFTRRENFRRDGDKCFIDIVTFVNEERQCWQRFYKIVSSTNRGQLRVRQSHVYGEWLRGPRRFPVDVWTDPDGIDRRTREKSRRTVEVPCDDPFAFVACAILGRPGGGGHRNTLARSLLAGDGNTGSIDFCAGCR